MAQVILLMTCILGWFKAYQAEKGGLYLLVHQEGPVHWFIVYFIVLYSLFLVQCALNYTITDRSLIIQLLGKSTIVDTPLSCFCFVFKVVVFIFVWSCVGFIFYLLWLGLWVVTHVAGQVVILERIEIEYFLYIFDQKWNKYKSISSCVKTIVLHWK